MRFLKRHHALTLGMRYILLIGLSFVVIYPLVITAFISLMTSDDLYNSTVRFIAANPRLANFSDAAFFLDYGNMLIKSFGWVLLLCVIETFVCMLVAYGFARFNFPFKRVLFGCVLVTLLIPTYIYLVPLYMSFQSYGPFHWRFLQTPVPLLMFAFTGTGLKNGLFIYIFRQFFKGYPKELEEAAFIDGARSFRVFRSIMLPGAMSIGVTCALLDFVWKWTDTSYTDIFMSGDRFIWMNMASLGTVMDASGNTSISMDYYYRAIIQNAALILYLIPLLVLFMFARQFLVDSIETTGMVG